MGENFVKKFYQILEIYGKSLEGNSKIENVL